MNKKGQSLTEPVTDPTLALVVFIFIMIGLAFFETIRSFIQEIVIVSTPNPIVSIILGLVSLFLALIVLAQIAIPVIDKFKES